MSSIYHILDKIPSIDEKDMQIEYEDLAKKLLDSGRMRIDTDYYCNFSRYSDPSCNITIMMTKEELIDQNLLKHTKETIKNLYSQKNKIITEQKIDNIIKELLNQTKKTIQ